AVCLKEADRFVGLVGVYGIDLVNRVGETGSFLGPAEVRGKGYGTEAKHLLLEYCFDHLHLHVLQSFVLETNTRSSAALAKQGYRHAGRIKWADVKNGPYVDGNGYDLMRHEWVAARAAWLQSRTAGLTSQYSLLRRTLAGGFARADQNQRQHRAYHQDRGCPRGSSGVTVDESRHHS